MLAGYFIPKGWGASVFKTRAFLAGNVGALGFMAMAAYGYLVAPDWMFMYLVPANKIPAWVIPYAFALYYFLFVGGFLVCAELRKISPVLTHVLAFISLIGPAFIILPLSKEYQTIATFDEFHQGLGTPFPQSALGQNTTIPLIALLVVCALLLFWSKKQKA